MGSLQCRLSAVTSIAIFAAMGLCASVVCASGQVFVVGEKTAEADVTTDFHPTRVELTTKPLTEGGYQDLIRNLESEQGFAHRELPLGAGLTLVANGNLSPRGEEYKQMLYRKGESAAAGERVAITSLKVERDRIVLDVNGGPYAKHRFLSHISLNDMQLAPQGPLATGARITLVFEGGIPEITAAEVKALLDPIIDFRARSAAEAYANSLSPVVRDAIESHRILVGMDQRMVLASLGAPRTKDREHTDGADANSPVLEEWIYGEPPTPIQFVRFRNGRVVRLEIAAIGMPIEIHDKNELGGDLNEPVLQARTILNGDEQRVPGGDLGARRPPTLAKPGEVLDASSATMGKVLVPGGSDSKDCKPPDRTSTTSTPEAGAATNGASPGSTPSPGTAPSASSTSPTTPCPAVARDDAPPKRASQPTSSSGVGTIGMPGAGLPGDDSPTGIGGMPGQPGGGYPGGSGSGMPGSGYPGSGAPGTGYPGSTPTLPGSNIPVGPNHPSTPMLP
jgi:hypothetical protein